MATSHRSHRHSGTPGFTRGRRVADQMTREHYAFLASSIAAERVGDAQTALEYHRGIPMFARSAHAALLTQLAGLTGEMMPWLWARWAAYQCTRTEDPGTESHEIQRSALDYTMQMFYADRLAEAYAAGDDPVRLFAEVMGEDWAYHQVCTYELHGLETFLDELADGRLAQESGLAWTWLEAPMGGYRIEQRGAAGLMVRDPARDESVELLDLGGRVDGGAEGWVIGRLVPTGTRPAMMFDTRPLAVDERTARAVADCTGRGDWIAALAEALRDRRVHRAVLRSEDRELVTDVPSLGLVEAGTRPADLERTMRQLRQGRDEIGRAAFRILRSAADGSIGSDAMAPYVAAAVLNAHAHPEARRLLVAPGQQQAWERWSALVTEPARGRLRRFAEIADEAA